MSDSDANSELFSRWEEFKVLVESLEQDIKQLEKEII